jgi:DNA-binding CsgD family transcriptional regulator
MEKNPPLSRESNAAIAFFTVDQCSVRVEVATSTNRDCSIGTFCLNGVYYVLIYNSVRNKEINGLTRREWEIALQIARGRGTKQIAYDLGISPHTTVTYINRIRAKLRVRNRPEMVAALLGGQLSAKSFDAPTS